MKRDGNSLAKHDNVILDVHPSSIIKKSLWKWTIAPQMWKLTSLSSLLTERILLYIYIHYGIMYIRSVQNAWLSSMNHFNFNSCIISKCTIGEGNSRKSRKFPPKSCLGPKSKSLGSHRFFLCKDFVNLHSCWCRVPPFFFWGVILVFGWVRSILLLYILSQHLWDGEGMWSKQGFLYTLRKLTARTWKWGCPGKGDSYWKPSF